MDNLAKKLIRDYIYYTETLNDVSEISKEAEKVFRDALKETDPEALKVLTAPKLKDGEEIPKLIEDVENVHFEDKDFKKIFRKLAIKCHPDKLDNSYSDREKQFLKKCYNDITLANDTYDWGLLLKVAVDLDVEIEELSKDQQENIQTNINKIREKISRYEESMAYKWYFLPDEKNKAHYLEQCANIFKGSVRFVPKSKS